MKHSILAILAAALALPAFAQLPTTCSYPPTNKAMEINTNVGGSSYAVTNATYSGTTATVTIGANSLVAGNTVTISGVSGPGGSPSGFNGTFSLLSATSSAVTYTVATAPAAFVSSTNAFVTYPGQNYIGYCVNGVVLQVPTVAVPTGNVGSVPPLVQNVGFGQTQRYWCHAQYNFSNDAGAIGNITPVNGCTLPANAIVTNSVIYVSTAVTSAGSATVSVGWGTGGNVASLLGATAKASLTATTFMQSAIVPQTASGFIHVAAASPLTVTVATAALTAGVIDVYVEFMQSPV